MEGKVDEKKKERKKKTHPEKVGVVRLAVSCVSEDLYKKEKRKKVCLPRMKEREGEGEGGNCGGGRSKKR